jgi:hypothetical protein
MFDEKSSRLLFRPQDGEMGACVIEGMMLARPLLPEQGHRCKE